MVTKSTLCDHKCPLHDHCQRYLEGLDRMTTDHIHPMPYKNNRCTFFEPLDEDYIVKKVTDFLNPFKN